MDGIDGLTIREETQTHPEHGDMYTLGECVTEAYPSSWEGPDTVRSTVVLYYGSFKQVASRDRDFDWEAEIWETLTHELRHHLESLAGQDDLEGVDYVIECDARRGRGEPFDPFYYQRGQPIGRGIYRAEDLTFFEQTWEGDAPPSRIEVVLDGWPVEVTLAPELRVGDADLHYVVLVGFDGLDGRPVPELMSRVDRTEIVLVRNRTMLARLKDAASGSRTRVVESEVVARVLPQAN